MEAAAGQGGQGGLVEQLKQIVEGYGGADVPEVQLMQHPPDPTPGDPAGAGGEGDAPLAPTPVPIEIIQDKRPYACEVAGCNMKFKNPQTLKIHRKTHANAGLVPEAQLGYGKAGKNKKVPSRCPSCDKVFVGLYELRRHYGRKHSQGEKNFSCGKCNKRFFIEVDLRDHTKLCGEPFECAGCKAKFAFKCNLISHRKSHAECREAAEAADKARDVMEGKPGGDDPGKPIQEGGAAGGEDPLAWGGEAPLNV